jgi:hypothetical protein
MLVREEHLTSFPMMAESRPDEAESKHFPDFSHRSGKDVWVLNSCLDTLFDQKAEKVSDFLIQKF